MQQPPVTRIRHYSIPAIHLTPKPVRVQTGPQFVDMLRRVANSEGITPASALTLLNAINTLKNSVRAFFPSEVAGPALTARAFSDTDFTKSDLYLLRKLRGLCRAHGSFSAGTSPCLKKGDFSALALVACMKVAISDVASVAGGTLPGRPAICRNLTRRRNQCDMDARHQFLQSKLGRLLENREKELIRWVEQDDSCARAPEPANPDRRSKIFAQLHLEKVVPRML